MKVICPSCKGKGSISKTIRPYGCTMADESGVEEDSNAERPNSYTIIDKVKCTRCNGKKYIEK